MGTLHEISEAAQATIATAQALSSLDSWDPITTDGWQSSMTNMGIRGKDKGASTRFRASPRLSSAEIDALYRQDGIAALLVDDIVDEAHRCGWRITFPSPVGSRVQATWTGSSPDRDPSEPTTTNASIGSGESKPVPAELVANINARLEEWQKQSFFVDRSQEHFKQSRYSGAAINVLGVHDGRAPNEPLDLNASGLTFNWMRSLDRFQVSPSGTLDGDPSSRGYGLPLWYLTTSAVIGHTGTGALPVGGVAGIDDVGLGQGQSRPSLEALSGLAGSGNPANDMRAAFTLNSTHVHASRIWRSDGTKLSERTRLSNGGFGESILDRTYNALSHFNSAMAGTGTIIQDFTQGVYGIAGLSEILASEKSGLIRKRYSIMDRTRSTVNAIIIDAEKESFERKSTTVTGLPELIDRAMLWLSAVSGSPMTRLFGVSPGGFGTGAAEGQNWQTRVTAWQNANLRPFLEHAYSILFRTKEFSDVPSGWRIEFNPLQIETPDQISERRAKNAQTDAMYMLHGAVTPRETAHSRFAGSRYGEDISLDLDTRNRLEAMGSAGEGPPETDAEVAAAELNAAAEATAGEKDTVKPTGRGVSGTLEVAAARTGAELPQSGEPGGAPEVVEASKVDVAKSGLNGAQITSLREMMNDLVDGRPLESVIEMAKFSFPTMTDEEATAMFKPTADKAASEPKPTPPAAPPGFGGPTPPTAPPPSGGSEHEVGAESGNTEPESNNG